MDAVYTAGSAGGRHEAASRGRRGARPGNRAQVAPRNRPAIGVHETEAGDPPSRATIPDDDGLVPAAEDPLVGPLSQRRQDRQQRLALLGQPVLEAMPLGAHVDALEDPMVDEVLESRGEDVLRDPEAALEVAEAPGAEEGEIGRASCRERV